MPTPLLSRRALLASALLAPARFRAAESILESAVASGQLQSAVLRVEQKGEVFERAFGLAKPDSPFLIASITKPMTATAVMILADRGQLKFDDPVSTYIPGFTAGDRAKITIRHLLTHTSGLPDMLPENNALRQRNAPLSDFINGALSTPLLFPPGTRTSYQSMGILLAAHIVEKTIRQPLRQFFKTEIFQPLKMTRTTLGKTENAVKLQVEHADPPGGTPETAHWDWNSPYWRDLGAPWGGAHSTAADIAKLLHAFQHPTGVPVKQETARRMTANQNAGLDKPWGIGWAITAGGFGHSGSTGTNCWAHFAKDARFVILTSLPARVSQKSITDPVDKAIRAAL